MPAKRGGPKREGIGASRLPRAYEGRAALAGLLAQGGASMSADEVEQAIREAQAEGEPPGEVFDLLFEEEPRFPSPETAARLYGNLFGLWDRIAAGGEVEPAPRAAAPGEVTRAPAPKPTTERPLPGEFVEAAWRHLADLSDKEIVRLGHRWENCQPELSEQVRLDAGESDVAVDTADTLAFELWAMLDLARGGARIRPVLREEYEAARVSHEIPEPTLDRYAEEAVHEARLDEREPLSEFDAERVAAVTRAVLRCLAAAER